MRCLRWTYGPVWAPAGVINYISKLDKTICFPYFLQTVLTVERDDI